MVLFGYDANLPYIFALEVEARFRRRGLGIALKQRVLDTCAQRGDGVVNSHVMRNNHAMLKLNEKLGVDQRKDPVDGEFLQATALLESDEVP